MVDDLCIVAFTYVVDVYWDGCISTNAVFLHKSDKLTLCEVVRCSCPSLQNEL